MQICKHKRNHLKQGSTNNSPQAKSSLPPVLGGIRAENNLYTFLMFKKSQEGVGSVAQVIKHLCCKYKTLSSKPQYSKKKKKDKRKVILLACEN
jgi:hypothetical protein